MSLDPNTTTSSTIGAIVSAEADSGQPLQGDFKRMARRRYQSPEPEKIGKWWYIRIREDVWEDGCLIRKQRRIKLCPAMKLKREAQKLADVELSPLNQGDITPGGALPLKHFIEGHYKRTAMPLLAKTTQECYEGHLEKYIKPDLGDMILREIDRGALQEYLSGTVARKINHDTAAKLRTVLSSVMKSAMDFGYINTNPATDLAIPPDKRARKKKFVITPEQFDHLVARIAEPYATMVYVAVWAGLRVSELIGLKWRCIGTETITIEERFTRGDWSHPKSEASAAPVVVRPDLIKRVNALKHTTVRVRRGRGAQYYKLVKREGPDELVFQSVRKGVEMNDENILRRHIKPAATALGIPEVDWRCLRRSYITWMVRAGADPKSVQGQARHARIAITMDVYAQLMQEGQRDAAQKLADYFVTNLSQKNVKKTEENSGELVSIQ